MVTLMRDVMLSQDCLYTLVERSLEADRARLQIENYETTVASFKAARKCSLRFSSRSSLCDHLIPAVKPPSTTRACPVTKLDSLLASQSAAFAISAGSPAAPSGVPAASHGFTISGVRSISSAGISGYTGA